MKISKSLKRRILLVVCIVLLICIGGTAGVYFYIRHNIYFSSQKPDTGIESGMPDAWAVPEENRYDLEKKGKNSGNSKEESIINILLIGTDARSLNARSRADAIIIASIDDRNNKLKFTSILRDTYVFVKGHSFQKINSAFAYGGPELLMDTIERNFKIKLEKYLIINFWGFEDVIDALGGIEIDVKDYEINEINKYIGEYRTKKSPRLTKEGEQHLDGQQALAYARIRKVGNGSYERNFRQRKVLMVLSQKLKKIRIIEYPHLIYKFLPSIKTNVEPIAYLGYAYTASKFNPIEVAQLQMPMTELSEGRIYKGQWVFLMDREQNSKVLNNFIFNDKPPKPGDFDVKAARENIKQFLRNRAK